MAQRISRAKRTVTGVRLDQPGDVATVLRVLYLVFNEGYSGDVDLAAEAIRLTRQLAAVIDHPEVAGLLALMLLHHARRATRITPEGSLVPLAEQDRGRGTPSQSLRVWRSCRRRWPVTGWGVPGTGRHRGTARGRAHRRGDRLGADRRVVRRARAPDRQPGRAAQPRGRRWRGRRAARRAGALAALADSLPRHTAVAAYLHERDGDLATAARLYAERPTRHPTSPSATT